MVYHIDEYKPNTEDLAFVISGADWCEPCKRVLEFCESLSEQYPDVCFIHVDVEKSPEFVKKWKIMSLPTCMLFQGGVQVERLVGFKPKIEVQRILERALLKVKEGRLI